MPGPNDSRDERVVAHRQRLAGAAEDRLLVRDEPRQPHAVDRRQRRAGLVDAPRGQLRRAAGRVALGVVVQLDDLGARKHARRLRGEPHHQHRAEAEVRDEHRRDARLVAPAAERGELVVGPAGRADHDGNARFDARRARRRPSIGYTVQSTTTSRPDAMNASRSAVGRDAADAIRPRGARTPPTSRSRRRHRRGAGDAPESPERAGHPDAQQVVTALDFLQRRVFEHDHLLSDVREVDRQQSVAARADGVDDGALAPLRMAHLVAGIEIHADARAGVLVDRDLAPAAAARTRADADPADRLRPTASPR